MAFLLVPIELALPCGREHARSFGQLASVRLDRQQHQFAPHRRRGCIAADTSITLSLQGVGQAQVIDPLANARLGELSAPGNESEWS